MRNIFSILELVEIKIKDLGPKFNKKLSKYKKLLTTIQARKEGQLPSGVVIPAVIALYESTRTRILDFDLGWCSDSQFVIRFTSEFEISYSVIEEIASELDEKTEKEFLYKIQLMVLSALTVVSKEEEDDTHTAAVEGLIDQINISLGIKQPQLPNSMRSIKDLINADMFNNVVETIGKDNIKKVIERGRSDGIEGMLDVISNDKELQDNAMNAIPAQFKDTIESVTGSSLENTFDELTKVAKGGSNNLPK